MLFLLTQLVEINGIPRIKISHDVTKVSIPASKMAFRFYGADGMSIIDLIQHSYEPAPKEGEKIKCFHPFEASKRAWVTPSKIETLFEPKWLNGIRTKDSPSLMNIRETVKDSLKTLREDHKRSLNPTPYKVAVSEKLFNTLHDLWIQHEPIGELY